MVARPAFMSVEEVIDRIPIGAGFATAGSAFRLAPETMLAALERRFLAGGTPHGLTLYAPMMIEAARGTAGVRGTGFNRLAHPGFLRRAVCGSFSRVPGQELNRAVAGNQIEAYNIPIGTLLAMFRAAARNEPGILTTTGLDTFADPRHGGSRLNERTQEDIAECVEFGGQPYLHYATPRLDVALLKASYADERGNVSFEREAFMLGAPLVALAVRNAGGQVFVEVDDIVAAGTLDPRKVAIPGHLVTGIVRAEISGLPADAEKVSTSSAPAWSFSGERRSPLARRRQEPGARTVIARRALQEIPDGAVVNLGAGLPMYDIPAAAIAAGAKTGDYRFSIEQGLFGGWPEAGGIAANPDALLDIPAVFDFYAGGGIDVSILSFAEVDRHGSVNVGRFGDMMPGCGGFVDITQNARELVFCGSFAGGAKVELRDGRLHILDPGRIPKFVPQLQQLTFNARARVNRAQKVTYITERAVFRLGADGLVLHEIAPGIDIERDVLALLPFPVQRAPDIRTMDAALFGTA